MGCKVGGPRVSFDPVTTSVGEEPDNCQYQVVKNDEGQYSIWPATRELPRGWVIGGYVGNRSECVAHIDRVWVDMLPRSVRLQLATDTVRPA